MSSIDLSKKDRAEQKWKKIKKNFKSKFSNFKSI